MNVRQITTMRELAEIEPGWRRLAADDPFQGPAWLGSWWRQFGTGGRQLSLLALSDEREGLVAIAPWYLERASWPGRTLRFLGSGAVCSDYLSLPCAAGFQRRAATAIADWLCPRKRHAQAARPHDWDALSLEGVATGDPLVRYLLGALERRGATVSSRGSHNCWRLELPDTWDDYLAMLSKSQRKRVRQMDRDYFRSGRARLVRAQTTAELERAFESLVELHQGIWSSRGRQGIFAEGDVLEFHRRATRELLADNQLCLARLELDGQTVAVEYTLEGGGVVYTYQSGMEVAALEHSPGSLNILARVRAAIDEGCRAIDFLRGDEPYKQVWRAQSRPAVDVRVFPGRWSGRLHQAFWQSGASARNWLRAGRDAVRASGRNAAPRRRESPAGKCDEVVSIPIAAGAEAG